MSYIFFGTPEFAKITLSHLIDAGFVPSVVVCNPDRPLGRKKIITPPPVKQYINSLPDDIKTKIEILQPEKVREIEQILPACKPTLAIVSAYSKIIPQTILDIPTHGTIGVHPSLLPKLRGASPIQSAILFGDNETGVSLYFVDKDVDHGSIIEQKVLKGFDLNSIDFQTLHDVLAHLGGAMIAENIARLMHGNVERVEQNHAEATFTKKFVTSDGYVEYSDLESAMQGEKEISTKIDNMVRALNPEPGTYTIKNGKRMKILKTWVKDGTLTLARIQMEGGLPQDLG